MAESIQVHIEGCINIMWLPLWFQELHNYNVTALFGSKKFLEFSHLIVFRATSSFMLWCGILTEVYLYLDHKAINFLIK